MAAINSFQVEATMTLDVSHEKTALLDMQCKNDLEGCTVDGAPKIVLKAPGDRGYFCEICKTRCKYDEEKIKEHNNGNKHKKNKAAQLKLLELNQKFDCFKQDPKSSKLHCMICNLVVTSPQLLEEHLNGKLHKKMAMDATENGNAHTDIKRATASSDATVATMRPEVIVGVETDAAVMEVAAAAASTAAGAAAAAARISSNRSAVAIPGEDSSLFYWCKICKMHGKVPPAIKEAHMEGVKHKKKEASYYLLQKIKQQEDCIAEDPKSGLPICTVCNIELSTQQLTNHLAGAKHKNKVKSVAAEQETADMEEGEVVPEVYWCDICKLSGQITDTAVTAHMQGSKHLKKVAQMQLLEKLLITEDCFNYNEETKMLRCNVCNIEHNTPQLLETHLESDKHKARIEGRVFDGKNVKRKYKDYDDPYQTEAKRVTHNERDRSNYKRSENGLTFSSEVKRNQNRGRDSSNIQQPLTEDKIRNLSSPHGEIKDIGQLMSKWAFAYYRNNS